jgi:hypothetical protein
MSRRQDLSAVVTAACGVSVVALTAAVISFSHMRQLALEAGESELASWLLPVSIDGAIVAAVSVILADSRAGRRPAGLTWLLLALGLAGSLAANIASAESTVTARAVAAWPPVALALGIEVLAGLARGKAAAGPAATRPSAGAGSGGPSHSNGSSAPPLGPRASAPARSSSNGPPHPAARQQLNGSGPAGGRRRQLSDADAVTVIRRLDAAAPAGRASRLQIQQRLGCGGSKAARLAELARAGGPIATR